MDRERANHQAVIQDADDIDVKRIGNLGELAFEQFCREYLPVELWDWLNEASIRRCNPESFSGHDFEVFDYTVDVKTSRDVSAFRPDRLVEQDDADDIIVMVWHRDNEDGLILLGWEHTDTLVSKVETQAQYSGEEPEKLAHLAARPMNALQDLGPNTAYMNQKPENPFSPGDRVTKREDEDAGVGVVAEVMPPEQDVALYGQTIEGEAVRVAYPSTLDAGPGDWRTIHPAKLASYCVDQDITLYTYKHTSLDFVDCPFVPGDFVIKPDYDDPDLAVVLGVEDGEVELTFVKHLEEEFGGLPDGMPSGYLEACEEAGVKTYTYEHEELAFEPQY
ncbi:MAG: hypothetical protein U5K37_10005 [Natrialbaceae archaeon]|nr:hypothetical protein [Natrialbaceae archaeon]